ncbi:hypothetical protein N7490_008753 [Penicillium lividum]|nr:hypothetical protein N7490_008753 [Penicillium lividum]
MSSFPEDPPSSSQFLPPQSAQARGSLFGGPSSDANPPSSRTLRPRRSIFGGFSSQDVASEPEHQPEPMDESISDHEENDLDVILRERPLDAYYGSEGESSYAESSDDEAKKSNQKTTSAKASRASKKQLSEEYVQEPQGVAQKPTYVLDRGLDLPPGQKRPNRWTGLPINYQRAIAEESAVYHSIIDSRAEDLAAHLYDAYVVRRQPKQQDGSGDPQDSEDDEKSFRKRWIAWPMPAFLVPRAGESIRRKLDGPDTFRMPPDVRPSGELEECIIATMMKTAKERFMARQWEDTEGRNSPEKKTPDPDAMVDDDETNDNDEKYGQKLGQRIGQKPTIQLDDDISRQQLRPLSRTAISQLDQLLVGLHRSLRHRAKDVYDSDDSATDTDDDGSRSRHKGRKQSHSRGRKRAPGSFKATQKELLRRFPLRDWAEVMGLASMTGLPANAVKRAATRCADLFEQDMTFRTFHEGHIEKVARLPNGMWDYDYVESDSETEAGRGFKRRVQSRNTSRGLTRSPSPQFHPIPALPPAPPPVSVSVAPSNQRVAPKPTHAKQPGFEKRTASTSSRQRDIFCPVSSCNRSSKGFSRTWNLNQHIKIKHPTLAASRALKALGVSESPGRSQSQPQT